MQQEIKNHIQNIVIPYYKSMQSINESWVLLNTNHEIILCSDLFLQQIECSSSAVIGKSIDKISSLDPEFVRSELALDKKSLQNPNKVYNCIEVVKLNDGREVPLITYRKSIQYKNIPIALEAKYHFCDRDDFNLSEYKKLNDTSGYQIKIDFSKVNLSRREENIIYLLILRKTQQEIGALYNISRTRIAQIIANICEKCQIPGVSAKILTDYAISQNLHKKIPLELLALSNL